MCAVHLTMLYALFPASLSRSCWSLQIYTRDLSVFFSGFPDLLTALGVLYRSPESLRDVRGFSVKFYTEEGNWDFVGNDIPVRLLPAMPLISCLPQGIFA